MLIESLGSEYAEDALFGTCFLYNGKPVVIRMVQSQHVLVSSLEDGDTFHIPHGVFTGWKVFKYPRMGYRKLDNGLWGHMQRMSRSYARGLNIGNVTLSRTMWLGSDEGLMYTQERVGSSFQGFMVNAQEDTEYEESKCMMRAALTPVYDKGQVLADVLSGKEKAFIPSPRYLVEPLAGQELWGVYMSGTLIGRIDKDMNVYGPRKNVSIIENMVKRYAA